ncbi:MAG: M28 family peptidase [Candidatus Zixiibacteriota bacterium]
MFKKVVFLTILTFICSSAIIAGNLYRVTLTGQEDARIVSELPIEPVLRLGNDYVIVADESIETVLVSKHIDVILLSKDVAVDELALQRDRGDVSKTAHDVLFQEDGLVLYRVTDDALKSADKDSPFMLVRPENIRIFYKEPTVYNTDFAIEDVPLDSLVGLMSRDTMTANLQTLQAFNGRVAGSTSNRVARDWIKLQLENYGYDTVYTQPFSASTPYGWVTCYNVVAVKPGSTYPNRQVIYGAHFDAVVGSPGADDNGSGTVAVLEIARALVDIETDMTVIFILFDSEEQGLNGAFYYADGAASRGDSIVCMLNMDMIGNIDNTNTASIKYGDETGYATLWMSLSEPLVNITGLYGGQSSSSDHYAFVAYGYNVVYASEYIFSSVYHTPQDSTTRINFDYMTRVAKATLATGYAVTTAPLSVDITSVLDGGDGQSLQVNWVETDSDVDYYRVLYYAPPSGPVDSVIVPGGQESVLVEGLDTGVEYDFTVIAVATDGGQSILRDIESGIPYVLPRIPSGLAAQPLKEAIRLDWSANNTELDFSHYFIIRDGHVLPDIVTTDYFIDDDFSLGSQFHEYLVVAVDNQGYISDTVGIEPVVSKAATLQPGKVLAVNRSSFLAPYIVDETETSALLNDVCSAYDYVYISDTLQSTGAEKMSLFDFLDYELIVLGGESGRTDDFGIEPELGGILEYLDLFMSMGGKVIMFGRWGDLKTGSDATKTITFGAGDPDYAYYSRFHIGSRIQYLSAFTSSTLSSDLVGVHSLTAEYPALVWDSTLTVQHSYPWTQCSGIPCPTYANLRSGYDQIIYTYDSRTDYALTENKPLAWKYLGPDYQYIFFEFPLSFMDRATAETVLTTAIDELLSDGPAGRVAIEPDSVFVNSGSETIALYLGDFSGGMTASDVDVAQLIINESLAPAVTSVISSHPDFTGDVLEIEVNREAFAASYGVITDTLLVGYRVDWKFTGESTVNSATGNVVIMGESPEYTTGDANGDGTINIGDPVYLINYIFKGGPAPDPIESGDANCDGSPNIGDAVFLINYIFKSGPPPGC